MTPKLWTATALTAHGNEYGLVAVIAETREEAMAKIGAKLELTEANYVPDRRYAQALLDNVGNVREVEDGVFVDWEAAHHR